MLEITDQPIDVAAVTDAVRAPNCGAILTFEGVARDHFGGKPVLALSYEAYLPLAQAELKAVVAEAQSRWPNARIAAVHRTGRVAIGEPAVVVAVAAPHRDECYEANRFVIDALKARVPLWKREEYEDGSAWKANAPG